SADAELDQVTSPIIPGYTADKLDVPALTVGAEDEDSKVVVIYTPDAPDQPTKDTTTDTSEESKDKGQSLGMSSTEISDKPKNATEQLKQSKAVTAAVLPNTGQENETVITLSGLAMLGLVAIGLRRRKKSR
ncbi:mucin-binding protein, partial [Streptococcus suis]